MPKAKQRKHTLTIKRTAKPLEWFMWFCLKGLEFSYQEMYSIFVNLPKGKKWKLIEEFVNGEVLCPHLKGLPFASQSNTRHNLAFVYGGNDGSNGQKDYCHVSLRLGHSFFSSFATHSLGCSQIWKCIENGQENQLPFDNWCFRFQRSVIKFRFIREIEEFLVSNSWFTSYGRPHFVSPTREFEIVYEENSALSLYFVEQYPYRRQKRGVVVVLHPELQVNRQPISDLTTGIELFRDHLLKLSNSL